MSYWVRAVLGFAVLAAGLGAFLYALYELMSTGTCASGGPYVSVRECPEGTFGKALLIPGGCLLAGVGAIVFGLRGDRPGARPGGWRLSGVLTIWCGVFVGGGIVALIADLNSDAGGTEGDWVGIFLAALFIPMGLAPLGLLWLTRRRPKRARRVRAGL